MPTTEAVLLSGGMDSCVCASIACDRHGADPHSFASCQLRAAHPIT